ncbi:MAG TPA: GNAT family N-acetyltransferase [Galbitalea sp.]|jgi:ribosomal protein S18 acetylase RimI-like enzyme|nr:GNAT family N-acetyltransferase [Galbitalea sp.]
MLEQAYDPGRTLATLTSAFAADPVERWLWPDDSQYAERFRQFAEVFSDGAIEAGTAWQVDQYAAVAVWMGPGIVPDPERIGLALRTTVASEKHEDMFSVLEQMEAAHPTYPHWYLPWLGVDASRQGGGLGGTLLSECLEYVDTSGLPSFLETPNPRTIPLYERHGFEVEGYAQSGSCPPVALMLRPGQPVAG